MNTAIGAKIDVLGKRFTRLVVIAPASVRAELWIVEVKTSLSLALLFQAMERRRAGHRVIVAAPYSRNFRDVGAICESLGIGLWQVDVASPEERWRQHRVTETVDSRRWNTRPVALAAKLKPEHKTHAKAGAVGAGGLPAPRPTGSRRCSATTSSRPRSPS
jgi:hypothetical protein